MKPVEVSPLLVRKYNVPLPRYTSYPTVPNWHKHLDANFWKQTFEEQFHIQNPSNGISLYIHLPFCEQLETNCGCNKKTTANHSVEGEYVEVLEKEWKLYKKLMKQTPVIRELHLGGDTPTYFSPHYLKRLLDVILKESIVHPQHSFSIEGHLNNATNAYLKMLFSAGFRRISFSGQDTNPAVQHDINRLQPFADLKKATNAARSIGFTSVNFNLVYGLPLQTVESITETIEQLLTLKSDCIALDSYAHVPWTSKAQRHYNETDLPSAEQKLELYIKGKELLLNHGYGNIGMDHFALSSDELYTAQNAGKLHRNFMGYTTQKTGFLCGLGVSSISDSGTAFAQNHKTIHDYYAAVNKGQLPVKKGYLRSALDIKFGSYILGISCKGSVTFNQEDLPLLERFTFPQLALLAADGLVKWNSEGAELTPLGWHFVRNVCAAFDLFLPSNAQSAVSHSAFSRAI